MLITAINSVQLGHKTISTSSLSQTRTLANSNRPSSSHCPLQDTNSQPHSFSTRRSHILNSNPKMESQRKLAYSHRRQKICAHVFAALSTRRNSPFAKHKTATAKKSKTPTVNAQQRSSSLECHRYSNLKS